MESNAPLAYDPGLEHHHLFMSTLGYTRGQLERLRERERDRERQKEIYIEIWRDMER